MARIASNPFVAVLTFEVGAADNFRILPAGEFRARDGRPANVKAWRMDATIAAKLIDQVAALGIDLVIDYEHQTLLAEKNGQPAPAAGWFSRLEWRESDGLYVVGAKWTGRAQDYIESDEYRYISPVFEYDKTGAPVRLLHVALTNNPALDNQPGVAEAVAACFSLAANQETPMNELLKKMLAALGLQETATEAEAATAIAALKAKADQATGLETEVAALKSASPDPARFVPLATLSATQGELAAANQALAVLKAEKAGQELDGVITAALTAGKLLPAQEVWARDLGTKDLAALKSYVDSTPVIAPLTTQTSTTPVKGGGTHQSTDADLAVMKALGLTADQFAAGKLEA